MQPNHDPADWKQPTEQPAQTPYVAHPDDEHAESAVVTLSPDETLVDGVPLEPTDPSLHPDPDPSPGQQPLRWQAPEYIHREKNALWYVSFAVVTIVFMIVAIFLIRSITFNILVPVMAAALLVYINRPPRMLDYTLSRQGIHVNDDLYTFPEFKGFGVIHDQGEYTIVLIPVKRFKPSVTIHFPEAVGETLVDMLGARLPMQQLDLDLVDKIIRKLHI